MTICLSACDCALCGMVGDCVCDAVLKVQTLPRKDTERRYSVKENGTDKRDTGIGKIDN